MARKNMSWDDMKTGGKFLAGSILLEALLLAPNERTSNHRDRTCWQTIDEQSTPFRQTSACN